MQQHIESLLENISSKQIEDLIDEHVLANNSGYKFYYAIDNHDIVRYCFPLNITGDGYGDSDEISTKNKINYSLIADYITAYEDLFDNISEKSPLFFLDEYRIEWDNLRKEIKKILEKGKIFDYSDNFADYYNNKPKEDKIHNDFTFFIALATGILKDAVMRFNNLSNNEFVVKGDHENINIPEDEILKKIFHEAYGGSYDAFKVLYSYSDKKNKLNEASSITDNQAIARLMYVNNILSEDLNKLRCPVLFLFLSTTKNSEILMNNPKIKNLLPVVNIHGKIKPFNFHRNAAQLFLNKLLKGLNANEKFKRLESAKNFISYNETNKAIISEYKKDKNKLDNNKIIKQYKELEKNEISVFMLLMEKYVDTHFQRETQIRDIDTLFSKLEKIKEHNRKSALNRLYSTLKEEYNKSSRGNNNATNLDIIDNELAIHSIFSIAFKKSMSLIENNVSKINVKFGNDGINGIAHHMPVVFISSDSSYTTLDSIGEFCIRAFTETHSAELYKDFYSRLTQTSKNYQISVRNRSLQEKLAICLYLLILPEAEIPGKTNNDIVIEFIQSYIDTFELKKECKIYLDYLYVLVWVLRRNRDFNDAVTWSEKALNYSVTNLGFKDARFIHSLFLISACDFQNTQQNLDHEMKQKLTSLLDQITEAQSLYELILYNKSDVIKNNIIGTLLNSEIYANLLIIYESNPLLTDIQIELETIRKAKLKPLKDLLKSEYSKHPEFLHTEAFLEKIESEFETDHEQKILKIEYAIKAIRSAIDIAKNIPDSISKSYTNLQSELVLLKYNYGKYKNK